MSLQMMKQKKCCSILMEVGEEDKFVWVFNSVMTCLLIKYLLILALLWQMLQYPYSSFGKNNAKNITCQCTHCHGNFWIGSVFRSILLTRNTLRKEF